MSQLIFPHFLRKLGRVGRQYRVLGIPKAVVENKRGTIGAPKVEIEIGAAYQFLTHPRQKDKDDTDCEPGTHGGYSLY